MTADARLVDLFGRVLDLCRVQQNEVLTVLTENGERDDYARAYLAAAVNLGAHALQINVPRRSQAPGVLKKQTSLTGNLPAIRALMSADIVIDLVGLLWSAEQKEIQDAGTRILMSREPVEVLTRMFPTRERRVRVEAAAKRLAAARELRVTSPAGTDVSYRLGAYPVITQYGYTDVPGRWDNLSAGAFLYTGAHDDGVDGTVVIGRGDLIFPFKRYVDSPIGLTIVRGFVERIEGDGVDADLLRQYIRRHNDPRAYAVSHIGWGMDESAQWEFLGTSPVIAATSNGPDGRAFCGNVLFSTGPNLELGGANDTACHLDIPLRGCSLYLDGELIVDRGRLRPPDLCPERPQSALVPTGREIR